MHMTLDRFEFSETSTIGRLTCGPFFCYTLEDTDRHLEDGGEKVYGKTAIPRGTYHTVIDYSKRFERDLPRLLDVPGFEGIRIHAGNTHEDTDGCILVGSAYKTDWVSNSRATFDKLFHILDAAYARGDKIEIEVL